jgi:hypothetical protein
MAKFSADMASKGIPVETREALALAIATRVMLDNVMLNYRRIVQSGEPPPNVLELLMGISHGTRK